jgi:hypothetical protein
MPHPLVSPNKSSAILLGLCLAGAVFAQNSGADEIISLKVDFSSSAYYPLVKERIGLFQELEVLADEEQHMTNLAKLDELRVPTYRVLARFADNIPYNTPAQVYDKNGEAEVRVQPNLYKMFQMLRARQIVPIMSYYGAPEPVRSAKGERAPPTDLKRYSDAMSRLASLYAKEGSFVWEIMNEPDLNHFLDTEDRAGEYIKIFKSVAPAIKARNPDVLIGAPDFSDGAKDSFYDQFIDSFLAERKANPNLPLDYFVYHSYREADSAAAKLVAMRNHVKDHFNTVPFMITEYENYRPDSGYVTKQIRERSKGAVKFLNHVRMLSENTDVATVSWNRYMTCMPLARRSNPGGFLNYEGVKRAIYNAYKVYGWMPVDRNALAIAPASAGIYAMASSDSSNAGVLLWNDSEMDRKVSIQVSSLPPAIAKNGRLRLYRIDKTHASAGDGAPEELAVESAEPVSANNKSLSLSLPTAGIIYLQFDDQSGRSLHGRHVLGSTKFVRSWSWCPRVNEHGRYVSLGDYGTFDPQVWTLRVGTNSPLGSGIAGVTMDQAPGKLRVSFTTKDLTATQQGFVGLRIDYWQDGAYAKSVVLHGENSAGLQKESLPWGKGGVGDIVRKQRAIGGGKDFIVDIDASAPEGWEGSGRRCIVSAVMQQTGPGAQSVILLSDG